MTLHDTDAPTAAPSTAGRLLVVGLALVVAGIAPTAAAEVTAEDREEVEIDLVLTVDWTVLQAETPSGWDCQEVESGDHPPAVGVSCEAPSDGQCSYFKGVHTSHLSPVTPIEGAATCTDTGGPETVSCKVQPFRQCASWTLTTLDQDRPDGEVTVDCTGEPEKLVSRWAEAHAEVSCDLNWVPGE